MKDLDLLLVDSPAEIQLPDALTPSLGLMYIGTFLKEKGYKVNYLDGYINYLPLDIIEKLKQKNLERISYKFPIKKFIQKIIKFKAPIVGLSCSFTSSVSYLQEIVKYLKINSPDTIVVLGGFHVSALPKETLTSIKGCDIIVCGEGEFTMLEIIQSYHNDDFDLSNIKGIVYRKNNKIIQNPKREFIKNLDLLPFPDRGLVPISLYDKLLNSIGSHECAESSIISSRGCPNNCIYCCVGCVHGRVFRTRSAKNIVDEIELTHHKYNTSYFKFQDDIFTFNKKRTKNICNELSNRSLNITWGCQTRVDCVDKELLLLMKKAGCKYLSFGVESGDPNILQNLRKNITLKQIIKATNDAKSAGLFVNFGLIIGNPGESRGSVLNTINFVQKAKPNSAGVAIMIPYPGSALFDSDLGKISTNWQYYRQSGAEKPPFLPDGLNTKSLYTLWQDARKRIYEILGQETKVSIIYPNIIHSN